MAEDLELKEDMFTVVPSETTDRTVLRLKKFVHGHEIRCYDPTPLLHFDPVTRHCIPDPKLKQREVKTPDGGVDNSSCSKSVQEPHVYKKKSVSERDEKRKKSSATTQSEQIKKEVKKSAEATKDRNCTKHHTSGASSGSVPAHSPAVTSSTTRNSSTHHTSGASSGSVPAHSHVVTSSTTRNSSTHTDDRVTFSTTRSITIQHQPSSTAASRNPGTRRVTEGFSVTRHYPPPPPPVRHSSTSFAANGNLPTHLQVHESSDKPSDNDHLPRQHRVETTLGDQKSADAHSDRRFRQSVEKPGCTKPQYLP